MLIEQKGAWEDRDQSLGKGYIWKGIRFSNNYLNQDNYGKSTYTKKPNSSIGQKTIDKMVTLVKEEEFIDEKPKSLKEQLHKAISEKPLKQTEH